MTAKLTIFLSFLICLAPLASLDSATAYSVSSPAPGFNPNNLITNNAFTDYGYDGSGVNNFLREKGSWLREYRISEYQEVPFKYRDGSGNCVWSSTSVRQHNDASGETLYNILAGDLIAKEGHDHGINPQVMLATLEKESSAISRSSVQSSAVEMWVLGYGWNDTMAACGYDHDTARQRAINFGGVGQQIAYATNGLRSLYNASASNYGTPFTTTDGGYIVAENQATRALYRYTPYVYNGNYNFWYFYNLWFLDIPSFLTVDAVGTDEEGMYSIVWNGERWPVNDPDVLRHFGLSVTSARLSSGDLAKPRRHILARLLAQKDGGRTFFILNGYRHEIRGDEALHFLKWRRADVVGDVPNSLLDAMPIGTPMNQVLRMQNTGLTYIQDLGENHLVDKDYIFQDNWGMKWDNVAEVPGYVVNRYSTTRPIYEVVRTASGEFWYYLDRGKRHHIPDDDKLFQMWGLDKNKAIVMGEELLSKFPEAERHHWLIRSERGHRYIMENGQKRFVSDDVYRKKFNGERVVEYGNAIVDRIPEGPHYK